MEAIPSEIVEFLPTRPPAGAADPTRWMADAYETQWAQVPFSRQAPALLAAAAAWHEAGGRSLRAMAARRLILGRYPDFRGAADAALALGAAHDARGEIRAAARWLERAAQLDVEHECAPDALCAAIALRRAAGDPQKAQDDVQILAALWPEDPRLPDLRRALGCDAVEGPPRPDQRVA